MAQSSAFDGMMGSQDSTEMEEYVDSGGRALAPSWTDAPVFEADEVGFPWLRLAQGLTAEVQTGEAKPGQWVLTGHEPMDEVTVVPLMFARTRRLDLRTADNVQVLCSSGDATIGVGDPGGLCKSCPKAQWTPGRNGQNNPPECDLVLMYGVYSLEHGSLVQLQFKRTSQSAATLINNLAQRFRLGAFAVKLRSQTVRKGARVYSLPIVSYVPMTEEIRETVAAIASDLVGMTAE